MDPVLLNRLGLDPSAVVGELQRQNVIIPGGSVVATGMKIIIQPSGDFRSVEEIRNVSIPLPGDGGLVYLRDLLEVRRGYAEPPEAPALLNAPRPWSSASPWSRTPTSRNSTGRSRPSSLKCGPNFPSG
jgi:multidrug efflux pump subunit AcrB